MRILLNGYRSAILCDDCPDLPQACCTHVPRFRPDDVLWMLAHGQHDMLFEWFSLPNFHPGRGYFELVPSSGRRCFLHQNNGCRLDVFSRPAACRIYLCFGIRDLNQISEEVFHGLLDEFMRLPKQLEAAVRHRPVSDPISWVSGLSVDWDSEQAHRLESVLRASLPLPWADPATSYGVGVQPAAELEHTVDGPRDLMVWFM